MVQHSPRRRVLEPSVSLGKDTRVDPLLHHDVGERRLVRGLHGREADLHLRDLVALDDLELPVADAVPGRNY